MHTNPFTDRWPGYDPAHRRVHADDQPLTDRRAGDLRREGLSKSTIRAADFDSASRCHCRAEVFRAVGDSPKIPEAGSEIARVTDAA
jgi:hypothetical protein